MFIIERKPIIVNTYNHFFSVCEYLFHNTHDFRIILFGDIDVIAKHQFFSV